MTDFPKKAMVMAAGLGTRMRPLTDNIPKPLVKVAGAPLIDWTLDWLVKNGVETAIVNSHYRAELLEEHLAKRLKPEIIISREETLLDTGGGIRQALPLLGSAPFFSANSDAICIDGNVPALRRLWQAWDENRMDALLLLQPVKNAIGYAGPGDFFLTDEGCVRWRGNSARATYVFTGVQLIHPRLLSGAPQNAFPIRDAWNKSRRADSSLLRIHGVVHDGKWLHIGSPAELAEAEASLITRS